MNRLQLLVIATPPRLCGLVYMAGKRSSIHMLLVLPALPF
jgi:hypothetical protein